MSIQSHVAIGRVGNRAAVFSLETLGRDVIVINTVTFSNHPGRGRWRGEVASPDQVAAQVEGVAAIGGLVDCDAVLSGYLGDAALGPVILDAVSRVRAANADAVYCCDPVMGDEGGGVYVRSGIPAFMRAQAVPAADIVTPNHFELACLHGAPIPTLSAVLAATAELRALGPKVALVTSVSVAEVPKDEIATLVDTDGGAWMVTTPRLAIDPPPSGCGDVVAALFLHHWLARRDAGDALIRAARGIFAVLEETARQGGAELRLTAARDRLVGLEDRFRAVRIDRPG